MTTFVLVADGGEARFMRSEGRSRIRPLTEIDHLERPTARLRAQDLTTDLTHRVVERANGGAGRAAVRQGAASDYDPHVIEVERFAQRVSERIDAQRRAGGMERLVLIAEPKFLGVLRGKLPAESRKLVFRELSRNLVRAGEPQIRKAALEL